MSEPRYQTRISDPDETTRIPRDALDGLRDADHARDAPTPGTTPTGPSTGSTPAAPGRPPEGRADGRAPESRGPGPGPSAPGPRNGSGPVSGPTPAVRPTGFPSDGPPTALSPDGRPAPFLSGPNGDPTYRPGGTGGDL